MDVRPLNTSAEFFSERFVLPNAANPDPDVDEVFLQAFLLSSLED